MILNSVVIANVHKSCLLVLRLCATHENADVLGPLFCLSSLDHSCHKYVLDSRHRRYSDPVNADLSVSCKAKNKAWFGVIDCMTKLDKDWTILEETISMANGTHELAAEEGDAVCLFHSGCADKART